MRPLTRYCFITFMAGAMGCAGGEDLDPDQGTFGDPSAGPTTMTTATTSGSGTTGTTSSPTTMSATSDPGEETEEATSPATGETTDGGETESDPSTTGGPSEQPEEGMYSACESAAECFGLTLCMTIEDQSGGVVDGYCTTTNCTTMNDCDPSPGGEALAGCYEATINDTPQFVCALDCSSGKTCPAGMECYEVTGGSICA